MSEKQRYRRKQQAQLNEWRADLIALRSQLTGEEVEDKLHLMERIKTLEVRIEEEQARLALDEANGELPDATGRGPDPDPGGIDRSPR